MAKTRLSNATYVTRGYGQVEPNHLSAQRTGRIYAQLPAEKSITVLENGQFAKYDYAKGQVNFTGEGEWALIFNEVKVYGDRETDEDFAMLKENYVGSVINNAPTYSTDDTQLMTPRVFFTMPGDIYTTNCVKETELAVEDKLTPGTDGYLAKAGADAADMVWKVVKVYTLADGQKAVKLQRIK